MDANHEAAERAFLKTAELLLVVEDALGDWKGRDAPKDKRPIEAFEQCVVTAASSFCL